MFNESSHSYSHISLQYSALFINCIITQLLFKYGMSFKTIRFLISCGCFQSSAKIFVSYFNNNNMTLPRRHTHFRSVTHFHKKNKVCIPVNFQFQLSTYGHCTPWGMIQNNRISLETSICPTFR